MKMKKSNLIWASISTLALLSCKGNESIIGQWTQPVPNMPQMRQGFVLGKDGKASSVNMSTLKYETWEKQNGRLILAGKSVGNRQTIAFSDTFAVEQPTQDRLILTKGDLKLEYSRQKCQ